MILIDNLCERIFDSIFSKIDSAIRDINLKRSCKNELKEILEEYEDETLYILLDKFITTNKILNFFEQSINHYLDNNMVFIEEVKNIAEQFCSSYKGQLYYFGNEYIMQLFGKIALCIFKYRYPLQQSSDAEKIVANVRKDIQENTSTIANSIRILDDKLDGIIKKMINDAPKIADKKFLFIDKFQQKLFLEDKSSNPICLKDVYVSQRYRENGRVENNIEKCLDDFLLSNDAENIIFVVGRIAAGKSSLLCKLLYKYRFRNDMIALQIKDFARYDSLIRALLDKLNCNESDLAGKILVLDGYDEAKIVKEKDANINKICMDFVQAIQELVPRNKALKVIITVRTEFFSIRGWQEHYENIRVLELLDFNKSQIKEFEDKYLTRKKIQKTNLRFIASELNQTKMKLVSNPMMLYMLCHYEGELGGNLSKSGIYERIFGRNGSLFLNLYKGKGRAEEDLIIEENYAAIKKIAFYIYKNNYSKLQLKEYKQYISNSDFSFISLPGIDIIKENNSDIGEIEFVHDSICSYYAAEYIYGKINMLYEDKNMEKEKILKTVDEVFSYGNIKGQVFEFLSYFIQERSLYRKELQRKILLESITYVCERNCIYEINNDTSVSLLDRIHNAFNGYWKTLMLLYSKISKEDKSPLVLRNLIYNNATWKNIARLLKNGSYDKMDLRGADFTDMDLRCVILRDSNLSNSTLKNTDLRGASLVGTKLCDANLENANLNGADLCRANLRNANVYRLKLRGSVLKECKFKGCINICEVKFSYANVFYVQDVIPNDLRNCYVYDKHGRMKRYEDFQKEEINS